MTSFTNDLRSWLDNPATPCAQRAERAQPTAVEGSARCARSAHWAGELEWVGGRGWSEDAQYVFFERLGMADELRIPSVVGSPAWDIAVREASAMGRLAAAAVAFSPQVEAARLAGVVGEVLECSVRASITSGTRFLDEPKWTAQSRGGRP